MAKNTAIKDETAIRLAKLHCKPEQKWEAKHHAMFIWDFFRMELGFAPKGTPVDKDGNPIEKPTAEQQAEADKLAISTAAKKWDAIYNNARVAYASNQAKGMAEAGVCAKPESADESTAQYA